MENIMKENSSSKSMDMSKVFKKKSMSEQYFCLREELELSEQQIAEDKIKDAKYSLIVMRKQYGL